MKNLSFKFEKGEFFIYILLMKITVNGQQKEVISDNLKEIIETLGFDVNNYVVILNDEIVPKSKLIETRIKENDSIEILTIMGGG